MRVGLVLMCLAAVWNVAAGIWCACVHEWAAAIACGALAAVYIAVSVVLVQTLRS